MNIPDLFSDASFRQQIGMQIALGLCALLCGWTVFNTRRAMNWLARLGPSWSPFRETSISMANQPAWIWFYRIDCAVVFMAIVLILVSHWLSR